MKSFLFSQFFLLIPILLAYPSSRLGIAEKTNIFETHAIGYYSGNEFIRIAEQEFKNYVVNTMELKGPVVFGSFKLRSVGQNNYYAVKTLISNGGKQVSYSLMLQYDAKRVRYVMAGETCNCKGSCFD